MKQNRAVFARADRILNGTYLKVESAGFVRVVPERSGKGARTSARQNNEKNKNIKAEGYRVSADSHQRTLSVMFSFI